MSPARSSGGDLSPFRDPQWDAPLDTAREIESIPSAAQIRGMFIIPVLAEAKRAGVTLSKRGRYVPFQFYPMREHAQLLVEACAVVFPKVPIREALRRLGRGAPRAFVQSTLGRVVLQSAEGAVQIINALAKGYELNMQPGRATVQQLGPKLLTVTLEDVCFFIDSHHVGTFEGALQFAREYGRVRVQRIDSSHAVLQIKW